MRHPAEQAPEQRLEHLSLVLNDAHETVDRNFLPEFYRHSYGSREDQQKSELAQFHWIRDDITETLENDQTLPRALDLLTKMGSMQPSLRVSANFAEAVGYDAGQIISINQDRIQEVAETNSVLRGQALSLLFDSLATMGRALFVHRHRGYLAEHLAEAALYDLSQGSYDWAPKYRAVATALFDRCADAQTTVGMGNIDALLDNEASGDLGAAMYEELSARLPDFPPFCEGKSGNGRITRSQYIGYGLRVRNWLLSNANNAGERDDAAATFAAIKADGDTLGLSPLLWSAALRELHSPTYCSARALSHELASETLERFGFSYTELRNAWHEGRRQARADIPPDHASRYFDSIVRDNLRSIQRLESHTPGSALTLRKQFGLRNLARYPLRLLVQQYEERDNTDVPYGAMIYSTYDHNDALYVYNFHNQLLTFHKAAQEAGFALRIYECASLTGVARALLNAKHTYHRKLGFIVGVGHGWQDGITLSRSENNKGNLTTSDIWMTNHYNPKRRERYRALFAPGATGALFSCSTGKEFGIGDAVADFLDIPLTAPTESVSCKSLTGYPNQEGLDVAIEYTPHTPRACGSRLDNWYIW